MKVVSEITLIDERNSNLFNVGYHGTKFEQRELHIH